MNSKTEVATIPEPAPIMTLQFGALCDPIVKQLKEQGITIPEKDGERFQMILDALITLKLQGILRDSTVLKAEHRLMKQISDCIHSRGVP